MANLNLSGSIGTTGTAILGSASVVLTDANHTLSVAEYTNQYIAVTSSVSLTATRDIVVPVVTGLIFVVKNATTGSQSVRIIGATGTGYTVTNGTTAIVVCDGTNYLAVSGFTAGGDLTGSSTSQTVAKINGNAVSSTVLTATQDGYVLTWDNGTSQYTAKPAATASFVTMSGDTTGSSASNTVTKIQGNLIQALTLGSTQDGYVLTWENSTSQYKAKPAPTTTFLSLTGDVTGSTSASVVTKIQGNPVQVLSLGSTQDGYVLTWENSTSQYKAKPTASTSFVTLSGDVTGNSASNIVTKIQGNPVQSGSLSSIQDGYALVWKNSFSQFRPSKIANFGAANIVLPDANHTLTFDEYQNSYINVSGTLTTQRDIVLPLTEGLAFIIDNATTGGNSIRAIGATGTGQTVNNGNRLLVVCDGYNYQTISIIDSVGGDLGDFLPNPTVRKIWNVSIPQVVPATPTATSGFIVGNVLRVTNVTANSQAMAYGTLNLGTGGATTNTSGILPSANQAPQNFTGDLTGFSNSSGSAWNADIYGAVVAKIQKTPVQFVSMGAQQDGYVLTYSFTNGRWEPQSSLTGASLSGDVTGAPGTNSLTKIQGKNLVVPSPTNNQVLTFNTSLNRWEAQDHGIFGDITGTLSSSIVSKIRTNPVANQSLGSVEDGYVFTWDFSSTSWKAAPPASGTAPGGTAGGDLAGFYPNPSVISINGTTVPPAPTTNTVLKAVNSTTGTWGLITFANIASNTIVDNNISSSAGILGTKISPNFGSQNILTSGNITSSSGTITSLTFGVNNGSTVPTITSGTGVPVTSPPDGSVFYRTDGTNVSAIYTRQSGAWFPVGAAASGTAGGDLSGNYPNPTVIALQQNPVDNTLLSITQDGYVLTWNNSTSRWVAKPGSTTLGGDVTGAASANTAIKIQNIPILAGTPTDGYVLTYVAANTRWEYKPTNVSGSAPSIYDENVFVATRFKLNLDGYGVTATDNVGLSQVDITIPGKGIQWFGSDMPFRNKINLTGPGVAVVDDPGNDRSTVTINGVTAYDHGTPLTGGRPVFDFDGYGVSIVDNGGLNKIIITIPGTAVSAAGTPLPFAPRLNFDTGLVATYNPGFNRIDITAGATGAAGGDLSGSYPNPSVVRINNNPVSPAILNSFQDGYVLTWDNGIGEYQAKPPVTFSLTFAGDLSGTNFSQTVNKINGNPVSATLNTSTQDGYVLTWNNVAGEYQAKPSSGSGFVAGGDLGGTSSSQIVLSIHGATVPIAGSLTVGNGLYVSGASALSYSGLNLAGGSDYVFGILPTANQANQTMVGDVTGTTGASTVAKLRGVNVSATAPTDGYVLTFVAGSTDWEPKPPASSSGIAFYEEGTLVATRSALNVIGGTATIVDDPGNGRVNLIITASTSGTDHVDFNGYGVIQDGLAEVGQFISNARFKTVYDFVPTLVQLDDTDSTPTKDVSATPNAFSSDGYFQKNTFGASVTFTLTADGYTDTFDVTWGQRNYFGTGPAGSNTAAFISKLNSAVSKTVDSLFTVNANATEKIYFACRSGYGTPQIFFNGFAGGFSTTYTVSVKNPYGFTENYTLYESDNLGLGITSIEVYP